MYLDLNGMRDLIIIQDHQKSKIQIFVSEVKKLLTGNIDVNYMPPNPRRLAIFIEKNIHISEDKEYWIFKIYK